MRIYLLGILLFITINGFSQEYQYVYRNSSDSSFNCYLKIIPTSRPIKGLIVRDFSNLPKKGKNSPYQFTELAKEAGFLTLITNTSNVFPELFVTDDPMNLLSQMINEVVEEYEIPSTNIFIGGISASGTRALRFAQYCSQGKSNVEIAGVFAIDSPLDLARFYNSAKENQLQFKAGMLEEAKYMVPFFERVFNGNPTNSYPSYQNASVFSHHTINGGNIQYLKNTPIIQFHEPDIDWWITERGAGYYDLNSYDIVSSTLILKSLGNQDVELITTTQKGYDKQGNRKCHSWSIVDEKYLIQWIIKRLR